MWVSDSFFQVSDSQVCSVLFQSHYPSIQYLLFLFYHFTDCFPLFSLYVPLLDSRSFCGLSSFLSGVAWEFLPDVPSSACLATALVFVLVWTGDLELNHWSCSSFLWALQILSVVVQLCIHASCLAIHCQHLCSLLHSWVHWVACPVLICRRLPKL